MKNKREIIQMIEQIENKQILRRIYLFLVVIIGGQS